MASASSLSVSFKFPLSSASKCLPMSRISSIGFPQRKRSIGNYPSFVNKIIMSSSKEPPAEIGLTQKASDSLKIGSPIIIVEAPKMLKTAASMPCLRANSGLVKAGDVGRIMSRKPKDVWAVRLAIGTFLIDGIYFKPLQLDDNN